jgi:tRNA-(ms[2]io[6]A)-hydroxylase
MVWAEMKKRGYELGKQRKDDYVNLLIQNEPKGVPGEEKLLHKLMICALIEARSCERFRLLSEGLEEEALRTFYYKFMVSEAGHYRMFIIGRSCDAQRKQAGDKVARYKEVELKF